MVNISSGNILTIENCDDKGLLSIAKQVSVELMITKAQQCTVEENQIRDVVFQC